MKSVILLTLALFLVSAPEPDSATIAEFSANFIVLDDQAALQAAERTVTMEAKARDQAPPGAHTCHREP